MTTAKLQQSPAIVEDQGGRLWSDPEALQDACIASLDSMLGHDVERLAAVSGISRRELNKQRERRADKLGKQWLHRLCALGRATAIRFGAERTAPAARLFARACGHELASAVPAAAVAGETESELAVLARAMKEFSEAAAGVAGAAVDGIDRREALALLPEVDEALQELQSVRRLLVERSTPAIQRVGDPPRNRT